eukprot:c24589_g1_i1 orf=892-4791(+)
MAQAAVSRTYKIDKLTDRNYQPWRMTMEIVLQKLNLLDIVDGGTLCPDRADPAQAQAVQDWEGRDLTARLELLLHMDDAQKQTVRTKTTAFDIWTQLRDTYEHKNVGSQVHNLKTLIKLNMNESEDVEKFIQGWRVQLDNVIISGLPLPTQVQAVLLLAALPPSWQAFTTTQSASATISVPTLIPAILQENSLRSANQSSQPSNSSTMAMYAHNRGRPRSSNRPFQRRSTHTKPHTHSKGRQYNSNFRLTKPHCKICDRPGHLAKDCWSRPGYKGKSHHHRGQAHCASDSASSYSSKDESSCASPTSDHSLDEDAFLAFLTFHTAENIPSSTWLLDTGATCHLTSSHHHLTNYKPLTVPFAVRFGNNGVQQAIGVGTAQIELPDGNIVAISEVYHVPNIAKNLISVSKVTSQGTSIEFFHSHSLIRHRLPRGRTYVASCPRLGRLYLLGRSEPINEAYSASLADSHVHTTLLWHYRLGHLNHATMKHIHQHGLAYHYNLPRNSQLSFCEGCIYGKLPNQRFPHKTTHTTDTLELIHSDLCGPIPVRSLNNNKYFLTFIDDFTRFTVVMFLPNKTSSLVLQYFKQYKALVENQQTTSIKALQTDNGGEYTSGIFTSYCKDHGIHQRFTVPENPQQNGVAERKNRTLFDSARSMLKIASLPPTFWEEAISTACFLQNRTYTRSKDAVPYTLWFNKILDYSTLRVFGSPVYAFVPPNSRNKLQDHATRAIFVGYGEPHGVKGYRLFDNTRHKFFFSRALIFDESSLISAQLSHSSDPHTTQPLIMTPSLPPANPPASTSTSPASSSSASSQSVPWRVPFQPILALPPPAQQPPAVVHPPLPAPITPAPPTIVRCNRRTSTRRNQLRFDPVSTHDDYTHLDYGCPSKKTRPPFQTWGLSKSRTPHGNDIPSHVTEASSSSTGNSSCSTSSNLHPAASITSTTPLSPTANTPPHSSSSLLLPASPSSETLPVRTRSLADLYADTARLDALIAEHFADEEAYFAEPDLPGDPLTSLPTPDPLSVQEALAGPDAALWRTAMEEELRSLETNHTWSLVPQPRDREPISCKWVLRKKLRPDGTIARFKARLVARGFSQVPGLDYHETFSPVLRMASIRILFALVAALDLELHHLDVQTAFLHGDLPDDIYMEQPPHYISKENPTFVCKLHRSLYGLKQSPRLWFQRFNNFMLSHGYTRLQSDANIYIRHTSSSLLVVALYVDDIPIIGSSESVIAEAKAELAAAFSITDLGPLTYFLGLQVIRDRVAGTLILHQTKYVAELLKEFGFLNIKPASTPLPITHKLSFADC